MISETRKLKNTIQFPFRFLWNVFIITITILIQATWFVTAITTVFIGIFLILFVDGGFLFPLKMLGWVVKLWPDDEPSTSKRSKRKIQRLGKIKILD